MEVLKTGSLQNVVVAGSTEEWNLKFLSWALGILFHQFAEKTTCFVKIDFDQRTYIHILCFDVPLDNAKKAYLGSSISQFPSPWRKIHFTYIPCKFQQVGLRSKCTRMQIRGKVAQRPHSWDHQLWRHEFSNSQFLTTQITTFLKKLLSVHGGKQVRLVSAKAERPNHPGVGVSHPGGSASQGVVLHNNDDTCMTSLGRFDLYNRARPKKPHGGIRSPQIRGADPGFSSREMTRAVWSHPNFGVWALGGLAPQNAPFWHLLLPFAGERKKSEFQAQESLSLGLAQENQATSQGDYKWIKLSSGEHISGLLFDSCFMNATFTAGFYL